MTGAQKVILEEARQLLTADKTADAIIRLRDYGIEDQELLDVLDINAGRLATLETQIRKGVIAFDNAEISRNKITDALLSVINQLSPTGNTTPPANRTDIYHLPDLQPHFTGREPDPVRMQAHMQRLLHGRA